MTLPKPTMTATFGGAKTNRVTAIKTARPEPKQAGKGLYRADPLVRGKGTSQVCVSMPDQDVAELDALARRLQLARSAVIRRAVRQMADQLGAGPGVTDASSTSKSAQHMAARKGK